MALQVNINGTERARRRIRATREGLSARATEQLINRNFLGQMQLAAIIHTPSPLRTQDPPHLVEQRTGNLLASFTPEIVNDALIRGTWGAEYAEAVNQIGFSMGYGTRWARETVQRIDAFVRKEERRKGRQTARDVAG